MKHVKSVNLTQVVHFPLRKDINRTATIKEVQDEVDRYKMHLQRFNSKYEILEEQRQPDGSVVLHVRKKLGVVQGID